MEIGNIWIGSGLVLLAATGTGLAGEVSIDGVPLPGAASAIESTIDIEELRSGSDPSRATLLPGTKRHGICIVSEAPVAVLDAELPRADSLGRFSVRAEDGRELSSCLLASLRTAGKWCRCKVEMSGFAQSRDVG